VESDLNLAEILKHRVDHLESLVNLLTDFGTSEDDLAADKDKEHNLRLNHAVDETREQLRLVRAEVVMARSETLETNGELNVARSDNVLDLEVGELGVETELLDDTRVFARRQLRVIFGLGTSDDHLAGGEDQGGCLGLTNTHDHSGKTLQTLASLFADESWASIYLGVVLGITRVQGNRLQIQTAIEVDRCDDVPLRVR
jgi:hypothetical protein